MSYLNPLIVFAVSIVLFIVLLYRRVGLGISLNLAAFLMSFLTLGISGTGTILYETCIDPVTLTLVFASFFVMVLSLLYKETGLVSVLSRSLARFIKNSKVIVSLLPAIIGLMPVAGGALMSAPMVEVKADKLGLSESMKTYVNVWFRHAILPIYPISQFLILTAILTKTTPISLIARQLPVVIVMIIAGYVIGLRRTRTIKQADSVNKSSPISSLRELLLSFSPIIITILFTTLLNLNIAIATFIGAITVLIITRTKTAFSYILKRRALWEVTFAALRALFYSETLRWLLVLQKSSVTL